MSLQHCSQRPFAFNQTTISERRRSFSSKISSCLIISSVSISTTFFLLRIIWTMVFHHVLVRLRCWVVSRPVYVNHLAGCGVLLARPEMTTSIIPIKKHFKDFTSTWNTFPLPYLLCKEIHDRFNHSEFPFSLLLPIFVHSVFAVSYEASRH